MIPDTRSTGPDLAGCELEAPTRIRPGVMVQRWEQLTFLHWRVEAEAIRPLLPAGLEVDEFDGSAWIGLIPFRLSVRLPWTPTVPWMSTFAEANVRTYVRGPDGRRGIWFLSLDAARLGAVAVARGSYRLPYMWSWMLLTGTGGIVRYEARRRWPKPGPGFRLAVAPGSSIPKDEVSALERFLTSRWRLYTPARLELPPRRIRMVATQVDHPPWPLRRASVLGMEQDLLDAAGVQVVGDPLVLFSDGVKVRFARRELVG